MSSRLRMVVRVMGAGFTLQGIGWLVVPERSATGLGMPLLNGLGRSTQIGDFAVFFLTLGVTMLAGTLVGRSRLLNFPAALLAGAACSRMIAWAFHGAAFATLFIAVEILGSILLFVTARHADTW